MYFTDRMVFAIPQVLRSKKLQRGEWEFLNRFPPSYFNASWRCCLPVFLFTIFVCRSFLCSATIFIIFCMLDVSNVSAENKPLVTLFSEQALIKADRKVSRRYQAVGKKKEKVRNGKNLRKSFISSNPSERLKVDSVSELMMTSGDGATFSSVRTSSVYLDYLHDLASGTDIDADSSRSLAQRLLLYQSSKSLSELLLQSPLKDSYQALLRQLRYVKEKSTFRMQRKGNGSLHFARGDTVSPEKKLLEFRVHTSTHRGIEPRLTIGDNIVLRHDLLHGETLFEFETEF